MYSIDLVTLKTQGEEDENLNVVSFRQIAVADGQWHALLLHFIIDEYV